MTIRIFQPFSLMSGKRFLLNSAASHHVAGVLRARLGDTLVLFNGEGGEYPATIIHIEHKQVEVELGIHSLREVESPLKLHLGQGISRGEKMDFTLQKAVELGVNAVTPLVTERCNVRPAKERFEKKIKHWRAIAVHACEQCGRNQVPEIFAPMMLADWVETVAVEQAFVLDPKAGCALKQYLSGRSFSESALMVGPEGGLTIQEIECAKNRGFLPVSLGPRILRTETAGLAAISALQCLAGDMG